MRGQWANKRDVNEKEVIQVLRNHGCWVYQVDKPLDLIISLHGMHGMIEVKNGYKEKLTPAQDLHFRHTVHAHQLPHFVVAHIDDVPQVLAQLRAHYQALSLDNRPR